MNHRVIYLVFALLFCCGWASAQKSDYNRLDDNGNRIGYWILKGEDGKLLAKGRYNTSGERDGIWKFYMSPIARYTGQPDVTGTYENGLKQGSWTLLESRTKTMLKGEFADDQMSGVWVFLDVQKNRLAKGEFQNGVREGRWIVYYDDKPMDKGLFANGKKTGTWTRHFYHQDSSVHVQGVFVYDALPRGKVEIYKVENHPKLGKDEYLVGTGDYTNGKRTGRWIEYNKGLKGESIETGYYDMSGQKTGVWETTIDGKPFQETYYDKGKRHGTFKIFYKNGQERYHTNFELGLEHGYFTSYYEDGQIKSKGAYTVSKQDHIEDTIFRKIELPIEYHFKLVEEDYGNLNYNAIKWIIEPDYEATPEDLEGRYSEFLSYGQNEKLEIKEVVKTNKQVVRVGPYTEYYENGQVKIEGTYYPSIIFIKDPSTNSETKEFARDGDWKKYDDLGYLRETMVYDKGTLVKRLDDKGNEIP